MSAGSGARVCEVVVNHRPRRFGYSKYGIGRATRVLLDLLAIQMISSFSHRPLQYFALLTAPFALILFAYMITFAATADTIDFQNRWGRAAIVSFILMFMLCVYVMMLGLLAELAVKASGMHRPMRARVLFSGPRGGA
jgi:hypothetical protein